MRAPAAHAFPIVGIGASAGGLAPLKELLGALPATPGAAFVVIQHLDPRAESHLPGLLQAQTKMPVVRATHSLQVAPNHVYVIQPNTNIAIVDGLLSVTERPGDRHPYYPIDHFFRSLAMVQGPLAIGVVLSGTGSDGTLGLLEIKAAGGVTFAQDESAEHPGMPRSAFESGAVDLVLDSARIAARIADLPNHPFVSGEQPAEPAVGAGDEFHRVIAALRKASGVDFSQYRDTTIKRRTARRMLLRGVRAPGDYARLLETDAQQVEALYRDVLINVTSFFRDPDVFEALKERVLPDLINGAPAGQAIRAWVPGCSTGQEAYSLAMVLSEALDATSGPAPLQIFATDVGDASALEHARAGVYPESIEAEVSPERLRRFFEQDGPRYRVKKFLRDCCVFARQNVTIDPPFSRVDLVSCRNVLIYMSTPLQDRLLPVFHFALNRQGVLVLGNAESIGRHQDLFEVVDREHKIFRRKDTRRRLALSFLTGEWAAAPGRPVRNSVPKPEDYQRDGDRLLLDAYAPASVLVNQEFEIEQFRGRTTPYLEAPPGQPTANLLRMVKDGLLMDLQSALTEAKATNAVVTRSGMQVKDGGHEVQFNLRIVPVTREDPDDRRYLVIFERAGGPAMDLVTAGPVGVADVVRLRHELAAARHRLQSVVDDQDSANQELRAAHEEVLSSNEELQSTNEELETTKEELQSANEELTTVNEQFQVRNRDLDALTDEMSNFISSADLPMVTVGRDRSIRRLTPASQRAFNLLLSDLGRPIEDIKSHLEIEHLGDIIDRVIAEGRPWDQEVRDRSGRWWVLRIRPFVTAHDRIEGATLIAVDIDPIRRSRELTEARDHALAIVRTVREPLIVLNGEGRIELANDAFYSLFGESPETTRNRLLWETSQGVWNDPEIRQQIHRTCAGLQTISDLEIRRSLPGLGERTLVLNGEAVRREDRPTLLLLAIQDVTDTRQAEALRVDTETLRLINRRKDEFLGILAHELRNPLAPMRYGLEILRQSQGDGAATERARDVLDRQVGHMVRIVDDLLDVSRITQGKVELRKEALKLDDIVRAAVEFCRPAADAAKHMLTVSLPDHPVVIHGDTVRLTQVLVNLLNNAIKFTPPLGHIWVIAEVSGERDGTDDLLRLRVRDTGIGFAPEMKHRIFELFIQGDRTLERARGGLGVGLTLVQSLVALHGGTVDAWSEGAGRGSEFVVTLPIEVPKSAGPIRPRPVEGARSGPSLRILVADDDPDGRDMLAYLLRNEGHTVEIAEDGRQALEKAAAFQPTVAILDLGMPGVNGFDVARQLRQGPDGSHVLLIALSGLGQAEDKSHAIEAGFDQHFTKPVEFSTLVSTVSQARPRKEH